MRYATGVLLIWAFIFLVLAAAAGFVAFVLAVAALAVLAKIAFFVLIIAFCVMVVRHLARRI